MRPLLVAVFVVSTAVAAARVDAQSVRVGAYLGAASATLAEEDGSPFNDIPGSPLDKKRRLGVQAGLWLNKPLTGTLSFQPELHVTQKGLRYEGTVALPDEPTVDGAISLDLTYLEVPVLLRTDLGQAGGRARPFLLAGPVLSYQTGCTIRVRVDGFNTSRDCDAEGDGDVNTLDVGGTLGGGLAFRLVGRDATAGLRYTHGFRSLSQEQGGITNRNVSLLVGIAF